jgi:hypothetical protein
MAEPHFSESRFQQYCDHYSRHPHLSFAECQRLVDLEHEPPKAAPNISEAYMRSLTTDQQLDEIYSYQRQTGLPTEEAAEVCGHQLMDKALVLNASGLPDASARVDYARLHRVGESAMQSMIDAAMDDGFTDAEIERFKELCRQGWDPVEAFVHCSELTPRGQRRQPRPRQAHESEPTAPETHTSSTGGLDSEFAKDLGTEILTSGPSQTGPYTRHDLSPRSGSGSFTPGFKHEGDAGPRTQAITKPEPGALPPSPPRAFRRTGGIG